MNSDSGYNQVANNEPPENQVTGNDSMPVVDFNNPPLRRMRTSLVSRRRLDEMREMEVCKQYLNKQVYEMTFSALVIVYLTICYYLPDIFGGARNAECQADTAYAVGMFGWVIVGAQVGVHLIYIVLYLCKENSSGVTSAIMKEFVEKATIYSTIALMFINFFGYAIYFYWTQVLWSDISEGGCIQGYNAFDFINWILLLLVTVAPAITVAFGCCIGICCLPCIYGAVREYF